MNIKYTVISQASQENEKETEEGTGARSGEGNNKLYAGDFESHDDRGGASFD